MNTNVPPEVQTFINTTFRVVDPDTETEHFAECGLRLSEKAVPDRDLRLAFQRMDADHNGLVTFAEFYAYVVHGQEAGDQGGMTELMLKLARALKLAMRRMRMKDPEELRKTFAEFDADQDSTLSPEEMRCFFREALNLTCHEMSDVLIARCYKSIDTDGSRSINSDEFIEFMKYARDVGLEKERQEQEEQGRGKARI